MLNINPELLDQLLKEYKDPQDLMGENGILKQLTKAIVERCLNTEMGVHLGTDNRDMNNVVDTAREEGVEEGIEKGIELERARTLDRQRSLTLRLLTQSLGNLTLATQTQLNSLPLDRLERLQDAQLDFIGLEDLKRWLDT